MQAALYFPFINVPPTAWWTRTLLYWDRAGTIVPQSYLRHPDRLGQYTLDLVREGLVDQFMPEWAGDTLSRNFEMFLHRLSSDDVDHRLQNIRNGQVALIHRDKWLMYRSGLSELVKMGLALDRGEFSYNQGPDWLAIERTTASEFMAALTLALCQRAAQGRLPARGAIGAETWVPTTDTVEAVQALLSGLEPSQPNSPGRAVNLRIRGELAAAEIRIELLSDLLPVPLEPLPVDLLLAFRRKHGSLLPDLRRHLESKIDDALAIDDEVLRFRLLDRLRDELEDQISAAETYLREIPLKAVSRSSLLKILKFIPLLKDPLDAAQELAENARTNPTFDSEPLAYLAFARATFSPARRLSPTSADGIPLIEAVARRG